MALDAANFISELSITDPPGSDPLSQGDDQIRTAKRTQFNSFQFIDKAVLITADQMNEMAIKNEQNTFTVAFQQFTNQNDIKKSGDTQVAGWRWLDFGGNSRWALLIATLASGENLTLQRLDGAGALIDVPWTVSLSTGVMDFLQVPTVQGAALWIAGEIRTFVASATPGTNWFLADGTNGTVNLQDRWLVGAGAFSTTVGSNLNASLDAQAAAGVTGGTALTVAQLAAHNHNVRAITSNGGIGDVSVGFASNETVMGGQRNAVGGTYLSTNSSGNKIVNDAGSGTVHTHTTPVHDVIALNPTFTGSVQPVSVGVDRYQYVP